MNKVIYYFSGTGNNYSIAKSLANSLDDTDILPITELINNKKIHEKYEIVGFISPAYYCHIPPIVKTAMSNIIFSTNQRIFIIICCSGNQGNSIQDMMKIITNSNKEISQEFVVTLPGNNILLYDAWPKPLQDILFKKCTKKLKEITFAILNNLNIKYKKLNLYYKLSNKNSLNNSLDTLSLKGSLFKVNDNCIYCGRCAKLCPVHNIKVTYNDIIFSDKCQQCMACIQWCPQHAIYYLNKTQKRTQYHNPNVKIMDMINALHQS